MISVRLILLKFYCLVILAMAIGSTFFGFILPCLISAQSTELVTLGFCLTAVIIPVIFVIFKKIVSIYQLILNS